MADTRNSAEFAFTHVSDGSIRADDSLTHRLLDGPKRGRGLSGCFRQRTPSLGRSLGGPADKRYGMVAALCEEVKEPARAVPRAMGMSRGVFSTEISPFMRRGIHHGRCVLGEVRPKSR